MRRVVVTTVLGSLLVAGSAAAQSKTGTTIGAFMGIEPSARLAAMGNAGVGIGGDIQAVYYNPAALGELTSPSVQFTHSLWFADITYDYAGVAVPLGSWGTAFGSVMALNSGDIAVRTVSQPLGTGENYSVSDLALGFGFGRLFTRRFSAGAQVNYVSETIWHSTMSVVTLNFGTNYRLSESGLNLGCSLTNFGTSGQFDGRDLAIQYDNDPTRHGDNSALPADQFTDSFAVPILFRVGLTYPRRLSESSRLLVSVDAYHPSDNSESISAGWEWSWKDRFMVRSGYQNLYMEDSELGLTAGIGVAGGLSERRFHFDYAWAYHLRLQETHRFTFVLGW